MLEVASGTFQPRTDVTAGKMAARFFFFADMTLAGPRIAQGTTERNVWPLLNSFVTTDDGCGFPRLKHHTKKRSTKCRNNDCCLVFTARLVIVGSVWRRCFVLLPLT